MQFRVSRAKSVESFQIEKSRAGALKISLFATGNLNVYLLTEAGQRILQAERRIALTETILRQKDVQNVEQTIHVDSGSFYLVVHNSSDADVMFNYNVLENFDFSSPYVGVTGPSAVFR